MALREFRTAGPCYFTLENGDRAGAVHTSGDVLRGKVHLRPLYRAPLSLDSLRVNFKCKTRILITVCTGSSSHTHKSSAYLFCHSTQVVSRSITINSPQSWDVEFQFPWTAEADPSQNGFKPHPLFLHQPGHPLPPTWSEHCIGHGQSVQYYLEAVISRQGLVIEHKDKARLALRFLPPLNVPDPPTAMRVGTSECIERTSRILDPAKKDSPYGLREWTKHLFSSDEQAHARFVVSASAPTLGCIGDDLPVTLHFQYDKDRSTATEPPVVTIHSLYVRLTNFIHCRVPTTGLFSTSELKRSVKVKADIVNVTLPTGRVVYDGMKLHENVHMPLSSRHGPNFTTFSVNRSYMLKISAVFHCAGKEYDLTLIRHNMTIHSPRSLYRQQPGPDAAPAYQPPPPIQPPGEEEEALPPYER